MLVNLTKEQIKRIIEGLDCDNFATIDNNSVSRKEFGQEATPELKAYVEQGEELVSYFQQVLDEMK
jgi:hypothetical protein